jgi:signal transduction histidine kinase
VKGPEFIVETANAESLNLWGRTEKIIGQRVIDVFPEVIRQGFMEILNYVYKNGQPYYGNETAVDLLNQAGERYTIFINFVFHPIFENDEVTSIMTLGYNVTELVNARKVAQQSEADALEAKKGLEIALVKKDEFISVASHELKTPLTSLTGYLQVLERMQADDRNRGFVVKAIQQLKKLSGLVSDLLDVSKIEAGGLQYKFERADIKSLLEEAIEQVRYANTERRIEFESDVEHFMLSIDKNRIEQVMANLLNNAIKYAPSSKIIEVKLTATDKEAKVEVRDYGMGIADDQQSKLFLKYHRVDEPNPVVSGMGIGLFISKEIIERHSGDIWVESEKGKGSCFGFRLPV